MNLQRKSVSKLTSMIISLMRFPLPMAVCAVHTFHKHPITVKGSYYDPSQYPVTNFMLDFVEKFVADFSVPTFFFHGFGRRVHCRLYRHPCCSDGSLPADRKGVTTPVAHSHGPELTAIRVLSRGILPTAEFARINLSA